MTTALCSMLFVLVASAAPVTSGHRSGGLIARVADANQTTSSPLTGQSGHAGYLDQEECVFGSIGHHTERGTDDYRKESRRRKTILHYGDVSDMAEGEIERKQKKKFQVTKPKYNKSMKHHGGVKSTGGRKVREETISDDKTIRKIRRRKRDAYDDADVEGNEGEELPEPEPLAWVDPDVLVRQGAHVEKVPSLANLVGVQVFKYRFPSNPQPRPGLRHQLARGHSPRPAPSPTTRPLSKPDTPGQFFGAEFHDRFDKYYKSLRRNDLPHSPLTGMDKMGGKPGRYHNWAPRSPYQRIGSPTDNFLQLLNPFNLFGHNQFPQLPRYPNLLHPPGQRAPPPLPGDSEAAATSNDKDFKIEMVTDPNTEVYKGYHYKEDYPLRDDLYIGQDGNIYIKSDYREPPTSSKTREQKSTQDHGLSQDPELSQDHLGHLDDSDPPPSGHSEDESEVSQDDRIIQEFFEDDEDVEDEAVSSYSELLSNHNLGNHNPDNQFTSNFRDQGDQRHNPFPPQHDPRSRLPPRYPGPVPPRNQPFGRGPPPPWPTYSSLLDWLFPSFTRTTSPSYFYNPREVMLPRFRYLGPWGRSVVPPHSNGLLPTQPDNTHPRQPPLSPPRQPPFSQPRQPPPSQPRQPLPSQPRQPLPSQIRSSAPRPSPSRPTLPSPPPSRVPLSPNRPATLPINNRPSLSNQPPSRPSLPGTTFNRPAFSSLPPSRPTLSNPSSTRFPLSATAGRSPPQQRPSRRPSPHNLRLSPTSPPRQRQSGGRVRPGSGSGFYPGDGFFDADFSSAFHMAQTQEKDDFDEADGGDEPLPPTSDRQNTTVTATPVDQLPVSSSSS